MAKWRRAEERESPPGDALPVSDIRAKVRRAAAVQAEHHQELVEIMRVLLRPGEYAHWRHLRRLLHLAGHAGTRTHAVTLALLEAFPEAHDDRVWEGDRRPRVIRGVETVAAMDTLRKMLTEKWERKLSGEGMPRELAQIAQEYKLSPVSAQAQPGGRLAHLVVRVHLRAEMASWYYGKAMDYLWSMSGGWANWPGHRAVWQAHCEGATKEEIAAETGRSPTSVQSIIELHRARCGLSQR